VRQFGNKIDNTSYGKGMGSGNETKKKIICGKKKRQKKNPKKIVKKRLKKAS